MGGKFGWPLLTYEDIHNKVQKNLTLNGCTYFFALLTPIPSQIVVKNLHAGTSTWPTALPHWNPRQLPKDGMYFFFNLRTAPPFKPVKGRSGVKQGRKLKKLKSHFFLTFRVGGRDAPRMPETNPPRCRPVLAEGIRPFRAFPPRWIISPAAFCFVLLWRRGPSPHRDAWQAPFPPAQFTVKDAKQLPDRPASRWAIQLWWQDSPLSAVRTQAKLNSRPCGDPPPPDAGTAGGHFNEPVRRVKGWQRVCHFDVVLGPQ